MSDEHTTLGIETSCDETGIGIFSNKRGLLAHKLFSQVDIHFEYGGVVPELASRDHVRKITPLIKEVISKANIKLSSISGIAYTHGPGLAGALLVGSSVANSLGWSLGIPVIGVNHLEGHILSPMLDDAKKPDYPFISLLVSGGHTMIIDVKDFGKYEILGETLDDAVGEAFDKTAKILGLPYPGGPALASLAIKGDERVFSFPRPMKNRDTLDMSFSGLKTYARNIAKSSTNKADIAKAFEVAAIESLLSKCEKAILLKSRNKLVIAGGVSANLYLREQSENLGKKLNVEVYYPKQEFCTDNGAMIAHVGSLRLRLEKANLSHKVLTFPRCGLTV